MRPGEEWGRPATDDDRAGARTVVGGDAALGAAVAVADDPRACVVPDPSGDLARALGLRSGSTGTRVVPCDALTGLDGPPAVNAVVLGVAPDRLRRHHRRHAVTVTVDGRTLSGRDGGPLCATTVVVASGQYLRGLDLVPRGHPGDGRIEVLVLALAPGERTAMRRRLPTGAHVPHPRIVQASGRTVSVAWTGGARPVEVDGLVRQPRSRVDLAVAPGAVRVLV